MFSSAASEARVHFHGEIADRFFRGDVAYDRHRLATDLLHHPDSLVAWLYIDQHDMRAIARKPLREGLTEPSGRAGDKGDFLRIHRHLRGLLKLPFRSVN